MVSAVFLRIVALMTHRLINLASPVVSERIDHRLAEDPGLLHQQALSGFDLRQKLETYVLSRLPSRYISLEAHQTCSLGSSHCYSDQQLRHIDCLVEQGITSLTNRWCQSPTLQEHYAPSSWFG